MKNLETSIIIHASATQVWNILMDFDRYSEWNPLVTSIEGRPEVGKYLKTSITLPGKSSQQFQPVVKVVEPNREFRWLGKLFISGLFDGEHYFQLEVLGDQKVKLVHGEHFSGLLVSPIMSLIGESTLKGFQALNEALKSRAEQLQRA